MKKLSPVGSNTQQMYYFQDKKKTEINLNAHLVPRSKHYISVIKTNRLMLYREIIAVCSQIHTKYINTLSGENLKLLNVKMAVHIVTTGL